MTRSDFEHIAPRLRPLMVQVALDFFGSEDDAEDVAQEALLSLWRYCEHIQTERNVEGLAVRVAKNCCVSWQRRQGLSATVPDESPSDSAPALSHSPHDLLEAKEVQETQHEIIARLKPRERELFEMRQIEGLPPNEIAARTGLQKASVNVIVCCARKKVFSELKKILRR